MLVFFTLFVHFHYRHDLNLPVYLDTEIWKASVMLNEKLPSKAKGGATGKWKDIGIDWNKGNCEIAHDVLV